MGCTISFQISTLTFTKSISFIYLGTDPFSLWHPARFEDFFEPRDAAAARFPSLHALPRPSRSGVRTSQESLGCAEPPAGAWGQRGSLGVPEVSGGANLPPHTCADESNSLSGGVPDKSRRPHLSICVDG